VTQGVFQGQRRGQGLHNPAASSWFDANADSLEELVVAIVVVVVDVVAVVPEQHLE